jgi:quercetin dioxygenase-like cupin family protein
VATAGQVLENPVSGERLVFRRTAQDTGGEVLEYDLLFRPGGFLVQEHVHPHQSERHEVLEGGLGLVLAGEERRLGPGDALLVPAGTAHRLVAHGSKPVHVRFELRPALETEQFIEALYSFVRLRGNASATPLQLAVAANAFPDVGHTTRPPLPVQRAFAAALAPVGRLRGYRIAREQAPPSARGYVFLDAWDVDAPIEAVFDALADARTYPEWWKPVYIASEADGPPAVGVESRQHFKGRLPYRLKTRSTIVRMERPHEIEAEVVGDLSGTGVWMLTEKDRRTHVAFDWRVNADRPLLRNLTPLLRPLFRWNHDWAIARAMEGLEAYARARAAERSAE